MTFTTALKNASDVYGINAEICYDADQCTLVDLQPISSDLIIRPESADEASGSVKLVSASNSPLVDMTFRLPEKTEAIIRFDNVYLSDKEGNQIDEYTARELVLYIDEWNSGTVIYGLQAEGQNVEGKVFYKNDQAGTLICAYYNEEGRLLSIATADLTAGIWNEQSFPVPDGTARIKWYVVDSQWIPCCESAECFMD